MKFRRGVFIVTYAIQKEKIFYLVLKRKLHWKGWEFPKGGVEKNESLMQAAKREVFEETGLRAGKIKRFSAGGKYKYHKKFADRKGYVGQSYQLFYVKVKKGKVKLDRKEHSAFRWMKFEEAYKKLKWENQKKCLKVVDDFLKKR